MGSGRDVLRSHTRILVNNIGKDNKVLDFGASTGELANLLAKEGYDISGCEF